MQFLRDWCKYRKLCHPFRKSEGFLLILHLVCYNNAIPSGLTQKTQVMSPFRKSDGFRFCTGLFYHNAISSGLAHISGLTRESMSLNYLLIPKGWYYYNIANLDVQKPRRGEIILAL